ncbi:trimeric intracellular cation channel family protein [soil metagenome]
MANLTNTGLFVFVEAAAVVVSALSGMIVARNNKMDIVGAYSIALLTAFGGGTIRDILLERRPFFWIENERYLIIVFVMCIAFVYVPFFYKVAVKLHSRTNTVDAIGLGLFSISGLIAALNGGLPVFPATLLGVITGVAGGVLRDVVTNQIPVIFRYEGGLYAAASFIGCWIFIACLLIFDTAFPGFVISVISIIALRMGSLYYGFKLPSPHWFSDPDQKK